MNFHKKTIDGKCACHFFIQNSPWGISIKSSNVQIQIYVLDLTNPP